MPVNPAIVRICKELNDKRRKYQNGQCTQYTYYAASNIRLLVAIRDNVVQDVYDRKTAKESKIAKRVKADFSYDTVNLRAGSYLFEVNATTSYEYTIVDALIINDAQLTDLSYHDRIVRLNELVFQSVNIKCITPEPRILEEPITTSVIIRELPTKYNYMFEYYLDVTDSKNLVYLIVGEGIMTTEHRIPIKKSYPSENAFGSNWQTVVDLALKNKVLEEYRPNVDASLVLEWFNDHIAEFKDEIKKMKVMVRKEVMLVADNLLKIFGYVLKDQFQKAHNLPETYEFEDAPTTDLMWVSEKDVAMIDDFKQYKLIKIASFKSTRCQYRSTLQKLTFDRMFSMDRIENGKFNGKYFNVCMMPEVGSARTKSADIQSIPFKKLDEEIAKRINLWKCNNELDADQIMTAQHARAMLSALNRKRKNTSDDSVLVPSAKQVCKSKQSQKYKTPSEVSSSNGSGDEHDDEDDGDESATPDVDYEY